MKALLSAIALCGTLAVGHVVQAQSMVTDYEVWYTPGSQSGGACGVTNGNWSCIAAPNGNVAFTAINEAFGASFYNSAGTYVTWDGSTLYWVVAK